MPVIEHFRQGDREAIALLYRRVFGNDAAEANRLRWEWQYGKNPNNAPGGPQIWVARENSTLVGQYATIPVTLSVRGTEIDASWGTDVMVAPEWRRRGIGETLFRTWDEHAGAALGLAPTEASARLFQKLQWPSLSVPCLVKPLTRRAFRQPTWSVGLNRFVSAVTLPIVKIVSRARPVGADIDQTRHFDEEFTRLWERLAPKFDCIVRRDAPYLTWKYATPPHVRYSIVALRRDGVLVGYGVYRHVHEPLSRVTLLTDFLVDPEDEASLQSLLAWIDREAREADSDKIRCYATHAAFRRVMKRSGYFQTKSSLGLVAKINKVTVPADFYAHADNWHVTLGDSDLDR